MKRIVTVLGLSMITAWAAAQNYTTPSSSTTTTQPPGTTMPGAGGTTTMPSTTAPSTTTMPSTTPTSINQPTVEQNKQAGEAFLMANKNQAGVMTTSSGLQYKIIDPGTGPKPTRSAIVTVDYEGKHLNGQIFDSTFQRGQPATFPVDKVIPGWQEALQMMNTGATWELYIPAHLAYGERGVPGAIAPNETLIFKVHLIAIKPNA